MRGWRATARASARCTSVTARARIRSVPITGSPLRVVERWDRLRVEQINTPPSSPRGRSRERWPLACTNPPPSPGRLLHRARTPVQLRPRGKLVARYAVAADLDPEPRPRACTASYLRDSLSARELPTTQRTASSPFSRDSAPRMCPLIRRSHGRARLIKREVNDRDDDRLPWWAGRARHAYPDHRCCPDSHRSRLGARCGYCDRGGPGGVREAEWGEAHRVQRAEVPQCPAALSGRASARLAPPTGGQSSRGGCPTRPSAAGYLTRDGFDRDEYPPRLAGGAGLGWSAVATRAAGRLMCATCRVLRTDHTARRLETGSNPSAAAPAFATCFADSLSCSRRPQTGRSRLTGQLDPLAPPKNW
jgi:hypothetical protein